MNNSNIYIETWGYIKKEARLTTVENNIIPETLVLESLHPYPGYYGENLPEKPCPRSLFFIVEQTYTPEEIARMSAQLKQEFTHDFNLSYGTVSLKRVTYPCIRIKYLKSFRFIPELQALLKDYKVKFLKKKNIDENGLIVIHKSFFIKEEVEGIYSDLEDIKHYLELPEKLPWDTFRQFTREIKNNLSDNNFDAAQGVFFRKKGIVDVIRIYDCKPGFERFQKIRQMYLEQIKKKM